MNNSCLLAFALNTHLVFVIAFHILILAIIHYLIVKLSKKHESSDSGALVKKYEYLFQDFRNSKTYSDIVSFISDPMAEVVLNSTDICDVLHNHFHDFRKELRSLSPDLNDTDISYVILSLLGFKQKYMHMLITNISPSGVRNIKPRLKQKLPQDLFCSIFEKEE